MPSFSRHDVLLVRYPFSDLTNSKIRPAVVVGREFRSDILIVPLTSRLSALGASEFALGDWRGAGLNVPSAVKRGIYIVHTSIVLKRAGQLTKSDGERLDTSLRAWLELT